MPKQNDTGELQVILYGRLRRETGDWRALLALVRPVGTDPEASMSYAEKFGFSLVDHEWRRDLMAFK